MMKQTPFIFTIAAAASAALLSGCATGAQTVSPANPAAPPATSAIPVLPHARGVKLGQRAYADGPIIEAVSVIEDSRCPQNARCIWAGRLRVQMLWHRPTGEALPFIAELGSKTPLADGHFQMIAASDPVILGEPKLKAADYRFDFEFQGGY